MRFETNERIRDLDPFVKLVQNWGRKTTVASLALTAPVATEQETLKNKIATKSPPLAVSVDICGLFPERQTSIWKHLDQRRWMQWTRPLLDNQILGVMSNEGRGLYRGCYWGKETRHGVIDIDQGSKYREPEELALITSKFAAVGINLVPFQSSGSGGWHLYYFLDDWAPSKEIELTLKAWLSAHNYEIKSGTLEVFPSGNALRLPLQKDFAWLDHSGKVIIRREELGQGQAIELFLTNFAEYQTNWQEAKALLERELEQIRSVAGKSPLEHRESVAVYGLGDLFKKGLDHEKYQRGRQYWLNGLTGRKQRHDFVICVGHWLWYGDSSLGMAPLPGLEHSRKREEIIQQRLLEKHNGHSRAVNLGRGYEVEGDIQRACQWVTQHASLTGYQPYPLTPRLLKRLEWLYQKTGKVWTLEELENANADRCTEARARIEKAVSHCFETGLQITRNRLAQLAKCSPNTISKHRDLWISLRTGSGVLTSGGVGGISAPLCLASSGENGFDQSALVVLESLTVPSGLACGLTESVDCSIGVDSSLSRPVSEAVLSGAGLEQEKVQLPVLSLVEVFSDLPVASPLNSPVAPFLSCLAISQPESPQCQAQALRVPLASLTLGPKLSGIQALRHVGAGGILLSSGAWLVGKSVCSRQLVAFGNEFIEQVGIVGGSDSAVLQFYSIRKVSQVFSEDGEGVEIQPGLSRLHDSRSIAGIKAPSHCRGP